MSKTLPRFGEYRQRFSIDFYGAELSGDDSRTAIPVGFDQDVMQLFACCRFPGSVSDLTDLTVARHESGVEVPTPFAAMRTAVEEAILRVRPMSTK